MDGLKTNPSITFITLPGGFSLGSHRGQITVFEKSSPRYRIVA
jgi:hypothetical protein